MELDYNINDRNKLHINNSPNDKICLEENLIEKILSEKIKSIKENIQQIIDLIDERKDVQQNVISDLEKEILRVKDIIFGSSEPVMGYHSVELKSTRDDLDSVISNLNKAKIDEKVACWRDVLDLKKDLIELQKELKSIESKSKMFINK